MSLSIVLHGIAGADAAERRFMELAIDRLRVAVADPGFLLAVARASYVETRWVALDGSSRTLAPNEIAARVSRGIERGTNPDGVLDFFFELTDLPGPDSGRQVLGSTALGCQPIHTAKWFVERCRAVGDAVNLASHFMHEWMHLSGFFHWPDNKARGDTAYVVGRLIRETLAPSYGGEIEPTITALMHDIETDCGCRGNPATEELASEVARGRAR